MRLLKWEKSLGSPIGDKSNGGIFDNRKIKKFAPYYPCEVDWAEGLYRSLTQFESHPQFQTMGVESNQLWDKIINGYEKAFP